MRTARLGALASALTLAGGWCGVARPQTFEIRPGSLTAGEPVALEMVFTAPPGGIAPNGAIRLPFYLKAWNGLPKGLTEDREGNSLVAAERSDGGPVDVVNVITNPQWAILSDLRVVVRDAALAAGETVTVRFGDEAHPVTTTRKQASLIVEAELDASGVGGYAKLQHTRLKVEAGPPETLHVRAPSYAIVGQPATIVVYAEDRFGNVSESYAGELDLVWRSAGQEHRSTYTMRPWQSEARLDRNDFPLTFNAPGTVYVEAVDRELGLQAVSNPIRVVETRRARNLYWGEIHVHSQLSDGRGELADLYRDGYARGLDFIAITDHGFGRGDRGSLRERLTDICEQAERFHRPGQYVTIPAGETHYLPQTHVNLYFARADVDRMEALLNALAKADVKGARGNATPDQRRAAGRNYWAAFSSPEYARFPLAFPHHTMWIGIPEFTNDERQRLIEVQSVHGSSETRDPGESPQRLRMKPSRLEGDPAGKYSVREILDAGHHLGFVGGSDCHDGQPASNALTAVFAPELTRESILGAMHDRHCYATSANRTLIELSAADAQMGQRVKAAGEFRLRGFVAGDGVLDRVEVVGNGQVLYTCPERQQRVIELDWEPSDALPGYYYVRAILADQGAAWSSPIRLDR